MTKKDGTDWYTNVNEEYVALNILLQHHICNFLWNIVTVEKLFLFIHLTFLIYQTGKWITERGK